jgi:hypothetical protein
LLCVSIRPSAKKQEQAVMAAVAAAVVIEKFTPFAET